MKPQCDEDTHKALESLRSSVAKALDRKRRLGQYAVVWKDGKSVYIGPNPPDSKESTRSGSGKR